MILQVVEFDIVRTSRSKHIKKKEILYCCDQCGKEFRGKYQKSLLESSRKHHFCSRECHFSSKEVGGLTYTEVMSCRDQIMWQTKMKVTVVAKYGVENVSQLEEIKKQKEETCLKNYGVRNPNQNPEIKRRAIKTLIKNRPESWISKPEHLFGLYLKEWFGESDVLQQVYFERRWSVDFYVKSIDTYVQFDGVYWHGLDRPIEEIKKFKTVTDRDIYEKWTKDRELDSVTSDKNIRLVRITDVEFKQDPQKCVEKVRRNV